MDSKSIIEAVVFVTNAWAVIRKREEKAAQPKERRFYSDRINHTEIAEQILPAAYMHASGGGLYTVGKRQMYYAAREKFSEMTGREIGSEYFSQILCTGLLHPTYCW